MQTTPTDAPTDERLALLWNAPLPPDTPIDLLAWVVCWHWLATHRPELELPKPVPRQADPLATIELLLDALRIRIPRTLWPAVIPDPPQRWTEEDFDTILDHALSSKLPADSATVVEALLRTYELRAPAPDHPTWPLGLIDLLRALGKPQGARLLCMGPVGGLVAARASDAAHIGLQGAHPSPLVAAALLVADRPIEEMAEAEVVLAVPTLGHRLREATTVGSLKLHYEETRTLWEAWQCATHRAVVLLTPGQLDKAPARKLYERIVGDNALDAVIQLPSRVVPGVNVAPVLLVLDKTRGNEHPVTFIDATDAVPDEAAGRKQARDIQAMWEPLGQAVLDGSAPARRYEASREEIASNDHDLSVHRYAKGPAHRALEQLAQRETVQPLPAIAHLSRAQPLREKDEGEDYIEIRGCDIAENGQIAPQHPPKRVLLPHDDLKRVRGQRLSPGDILLNIKGRLGQVGIVGPDCGDNWLAGQVFMVIRAQDTVIDPVYLFRYLDSPLVEQYLREVAFGATLPTVKAADLKSLVVPVPPLDEQGKVIAIHQAIRAEYAAIEAHRESIEEKRRRLWSVE